eukprot:408998_1
MSIRAVSLVYQHGGRIFISNDDTNENLLGHISILLVNEMSLPVQIPVSPTLAVNKSDQYYNFREESDRHEVIQKVFDLILTANTQVVWMHYHPCQNVVKYMIHSFDIGFHILFHDNGNQLIKTLKLCTPHGNNEASLSSLLDYTLNNKLFIKYILSKSKIWKPLLSAIMANIKYSQLGSTALFKFLLSTMVFWKDKHYEYFWNKCRPRHAIWALVEIYRFGSYTIIDKYECDNIPLEQVCTQWFKSDIQMDEHTFKRIRDFLVIFRNFCQKKVMTNYTSFTELLQKEFENMANYKKELCLAHVHANFVYNKAAKLHIECPNYSKSAEQIIMGYKYGSICCAWNKCDNVLNKKSQSKKFKMCSGCKMVFYCSKKHQKRHWKFFHSLQCFRNKRK